MGLKNCFLIFSLISLFVLCGCKKGDPEEEKIALEAANKWLNIIDDGGYAESWELTAELFKGAVEKETWYKQLNAVRKPLGKLLSREVIKKQYMTSVPGAPDGEYVLIQYSTSFQNKKKAIETVTPMKDKDGEWRVSGYFIK